MDTTDDLHAAGWAGRLVHPSTAETALALQLERAQSVAVALRNQIHVQAATMAELASRNVALEGVHAENERLRTRVGHLEEWVTRQRATIKRLRETAPGDRVLNQIDAVLASAPCACLARPSELEPDAEPVVDKRRGGKWRVWFRGDDGSRWAE
jgi:hypothetical protein